MRDNRLTFETGTIHYLRRQYCSLMLKLSNRLVQWRLRVHQMKKLLFLLVLIVLSTGTVVCAQSNSAQTITNPVQLANSTWPIFHANANATAASPNSGPGDVQTAQTVPALTNRPRQRPNVSPWTVMAEPYADGSQAVITTPNNGLAKYLLKDGILEPVDFLPLDRKFFDFDWSILLLNNRLGVATEQKHNRFVLFGDANSSPQAQLEVKSRITIDESRYGKISSHFSLAPDGHLIALTRANQLIAIDLVRQTVVASTDLPVASGISFHNSFPIDDTGRIYLSTQTLMAAIDWNGETFQSAWTAPYDMRGPGCEARPTNLSAREEVLAVARGELCTGSGTTPTLIGDRSTGVVVIVDGHAPQNNLVAFWRDQPPADWQPLDDLTRAGQRLSPHVAGVLALPLSTPEGDGYTAENSPAVLGNAIVVAQWEGFRPKRNAPRGVQRVDWNPALRQFELVWANPDIHFNGVPTIACTASRLCRTYGMGRYRRDYEYTSLDLATGVETGRVSLGRQQDVLDQGNNHAVAADGSIVYSGRFAMMRVE